MTARKNLTFSIATLSIIYFLLISHVKADCEDNSSAEKYNYQVLSSIIPLKYQVYLNPCESDREFNGYVKIEFLLLEPTKNLTLHADRLQICEEGVFLSLKEDANDSFEDFTPFSNDEDFVNSTESSTDVNETGDLSETSRTIKPVFFTSLKDEQAVIFHFHDDLEPNTYTLEINYAGIVNSIPSGIYRKYYTDGDGEKKEMLLTNMYPNSARKIFPCIDDPAYKAETYFTIQTALNFTTITGLGFNNFQKQKGNQRWTYFNPSVNTSTFQNNFAVVSHNLENSSITTDGQTFVTWGSPFDLKLSKFSHKVHLTAMKVMERVTGIKYPLDVINQLIIPQEAEGASSSSLGFITSKKHHVAYNDRLGPKKKKDIILHASRDIVSQWINHLISPKSWTYVWLNQGLVSYLKYYIAEQFAPDHRFQEMFTVWELQRRSFIPNKISDGAPLNRYVTKTIKNIECLTTESHSSFSKAASLLRMMSYFLTENVFHDGISTFLKNNLHGVVEPSDFWESIQIAVDRSNDERIKGLDIFEVMNSWTDLEFYPVLNVTRNYTSGAIKVTQLPAANFFKLSQKNTTERWWIPITYTTQSNPDFNETFPTHWLKPDTNELLIENVDPKDWIIFNLQHTGYYRVLYDKNNWEKLSKVLNSDDYRKIPAISRAQIISDAIQFALISQLEMDTFLDIISYLTRETDYIPWYDAQFIFNFFNYHLSNTHAYCTLKNFCLQLITPIADKIGYVDEPSDAFSTLLLRRVISHWACHFGYEKCWSNATQQLQFYLDNSVVNKTSADLQEWARCFGLNGANMTMWLQVLDKYKENLSESTLIYLACSDNTTILRNYLDIAIASTSVIPKNQTLFVFKSVCLYPSGGENRLNLCIKYVAEKFDKIKLGFGDDEGKLIYLLDLLASEIRQKSQLDKFKKILNQTNAAFALPKLSARIQQTESRIPSFEGKANYYEPLMKKRISTRY